MSSLKGFAQGGHCGDGLSACARRFEPCLVILREEGYPCEAQWPTVAAKFQIRFEDYGFASQRSGELGVSEARLDERNC